MSDTELKLRHWRGDQIGAERLAAAILHVDGFSAVDPQCPLGGPDGLKDVICEKNEWKYIAAAYFPNDAQNFKAVREKFAHDLQGVAVNKADGIVFITNQALSPGERETLVQQAAAAGHKSILYHQERIRALLDSPSGYGIRLEFLRIPMSIEEQLSFFSRRESSMSEDLRRHTALLLAEIGRRFDQLQGARVRHQGLRPIGAPPSKALIHALDIGIASADRKTVRVLPRAPLNSLSVDVLCMLHGALQFDTPGDTEAGRFRSHSVRIDPPCTASNNANYVPSEPAQVFESVEALLSDWNQSYSTLQTKPKPEIIATIARFYHRLLKIHPFSDGNGRLALYLLTLQVRALLGEWRRIVIEDRASHVSALSRADEGHFETLEALITQAIFGQEFIAGSPCQMSGQMCPSCRQGVMDITKDGEGVECLSCHLYIPA